MGMRVLRAERTATYQAYLLKERKLTPGTEVNCVAALRFFFIKTLQATQVQHERNPVTTKHENSGELPRTPAAAQCEVES